MGLLLSGKNPAAYKTAERTYFTATAGQTTFTLPSGYAVGDVDVFLNGVRLVESDDFFATNGSTVVLAAAASAGDHLAVICYYQFQATGSWTKAESDNRYMTASGGTPMTSYLRTPNYGISSTSDSLSASLEASAFAGEQGVGIKAFGRSVATSGGSILYTADNRGASGAHKFGFWNGTSFTTTMNIDSVGRMSVPNQICFNAFRTSAYQTTDQVPLVWNQTHINRGSGYNTSNGRFTAPITGAYYFMGYQLTGNDGSSGDVRLRINGSIVAGNFGYGSNTSNHKQMRVSGLFQMNANDYIEIVSWGTQNWNDNHGGFCGFMIG